MSQAPREPSVSIFVLFIMAAITCMALLSELVPTGVLPHMSQSLDVAPAAIGNLVGIYALASALCAIPLITLTIAWNRKTLLMLLLIGFAISNFIIAFSPSYYLTLASRFVGGICAGALWPMITAYGMRLSPPHKQGRAIAIIMGGTTFGASVGMPAMTAIGVSLGWQLEFFLLALAIAIVALLVWRYVPAVRGETPNRDNSPLTLVRHRSILLMLSLTLLAVTAHYGAYVYITLLVRALDFAGGIELALVIFGLGAMASVVLSARYIDNHLHELFAGLLGASAAAMLLFVLFGGTPPFSHLAFFIWGAGFGALVTLLQAGITRQVRIGKDVATSLQSSSFNLAIMIASAVGGLALSWGGIMVVISMALVLLLAATLIALLANKTLGQPRTIWPSSHTGRSPGYTHG